MKRPGFLVLALGVLLLVLPALDAVQQKALQPRAVIVLLGPPGGGKGTQARFISDNFNIPAISTGDLLRAEVKGETQLGKRIQSIMQKGELVSDEIVNELVAKRITQPDAASGFILDGYPRTVPQAQFLGRLVAEKGFPRLTVLHLDVPESEIMRRLLARGRADDKPEVIRERLRVYEEETKPVIDFYSKGDYHRLDGTGTPEEVFNRIQRVLRR